MKPFTPRAGSTSPRSDVDRGPSAPTAAAPCADLRRMFDDLTREPMPDRLVDLCDKLEDAFRRGDLYRRTGARRL